jgi:4-hydroxy-tetrahydrodipicolinate reductase
MNSAPAAPPVCAVLIGASGRMGRAILGVAGEFPQLAFVAAIGSQGSAVLGRDSGVLAGGAPNRVPLTSDLSQALKRAHVVLDFSGAAATETNLAACRMARKPLLLGSTGYPMRLEADLSAAALDIPLLIAPNTSLGVTLLLELTRTAARALPAFRASVTEKHHREKRDAPSGTALALAEALRAGRAAGGTSAAGLEIPISSEREGEIVGEHTVLFAGPAEELVLAHRATDRAIFARGALAAALWLAPQPAGRYAMRDLLYGKTAT